MKTRSELRDIIVKVLYQVYILNNTKVKYDVDTLIHEQLEVENEFVESSIHGVIKNQESITKLANTYLKDWTIDRLSKVDKAILSLGIYELMYTDTPSVVCINETVELAKKYSDLEVVKMINATMDAIYHSEDLHGKQ
ncbi:MAG: transcription antitermination factor NusB [Erysipelotrichaceae bacterium]|nr:transcription antitermination factor NusB [Erysipelotrichaceae bacterium]